MELWLRAHGPASAARSTSGQWSETTGASRDGPLQHTGMSMDEDAEDYIGQGEATFCELQLVAKLRCSLPETEQMNHYARMSQLEFVRELTRDAITRGERGSFTAVEENQRARGEHSCGSLANVILRTSSRVTPASHTLYNCVDPRVLTAEECCCSENVYSPCDKCKMASTRKTTSNAAKKKKRASRVLH